MRLIAFALVIACSPPTRPSTTPTDATPAPYVLLEPTGARHGALPIVRPLAADHPHRAALERTLARPYLRWVLALGDRFARPAYFVITPGGNRPQRGFALVEAGATRALPDAWYVEVDPDPDKASILIPHEYGHVLMAQALTADLPRQPQTLPHTTGAITNDVVAFGEGWGIHFETLAGDRQDETATFERWHRDAFTTNGGFSAGDSMVPVMDLFNYAQTYRRYTCIKENCFAYLPRIPEALVRGHKPTADDVLARWTDTTYDPARVRSLAQLVASEGVIATLFYRLATAPGGGEPPDPARYAAFFAAFARIDETRAHTTPVVLLFLEALLEQATPAERLRIARIVMEVFHYTPSISDAPLLYAELHAAGHRVDKQAFQARLAIVTPDLEQAVTRLANDPASLTSAVVPELWIANDALRLDLPILGLRQRPLVFDLNAAPIELLMTLPGVGYPEAVAIDDARRARGLRTVDELVTIRTLRPETITAVREMHMD